MVEHIFVKKRQHRRSGNLLNTKNAIRLIVASLLTLGGFLYFVGDPTTGLCEGGCESQHSLTAWVFGFFIVFASIIALASCIGAIFGFIRWQRSKNTRSFSSLMDESE
ncbi:hypothetical protein [Kordiimonas aquimaris]|uniref:hypothetical protein n=1 Tax=Kordiimonas aquimaris TaxID=707591 RepID=UPI0021CEF355|nr:hypothetical protein [Kordiimonas aquimaris]